MEKLMFYSQFVRPPKIFIPNSGESLVETAGYVSAKVRIENLIAAGKRLVDFRRDQFDFPEGDIDEDYEDPTRSPNFDIVDAHRLAREHDALSVDHVIKKITKKQKEALDASIKNGSEVFPGNSPNSGTGSESSELDSTVVKK